MSEREPSGIRRRELLLGAAAAGAGIVWSRAASGAEVQTAAGAAPADPTKVPGALASALGSRSPFSAASRLATDQISWTPLQSLHGTLTPAALHFERHHAGVPTIDPARFELVIHGLVERPTVFTLEDLLRFPATTRTAFVECSGNYLTRDRLEALAAAAGRPFEAPRIEDAPLMAQTTVQMMCGLTSQSEWTGVALSTLLREVGVRPKARWLLAEGSDAAVMTRSIPIEKAWDDAMIVYAQNGEPLRPEQGYPARLLLPGWEGNTNVKWLRRLELGDRPFMTREETSRYTEPILGDRARQFSFVMDARSTITFPTFPVRIEPGWVEIRGLAWSGRGRITRVDVSTDGGRRWAPASLEEPVLPKAHTRFRKLWKWDGRPAELSSRAVDETGYVQPTLGQLVAARGVGSTPYHLNPIAPWTVREDGQLLYQPPQV